MRDNYLPKTKKMELKDLASTLNVKLDSIEGQIKSVEAKAAAQGQMSENLSTELKSLQEKQAETLKQIATQQAHLDEMDAATKRVKQVGLKDELNKNIDKLKAYANGESGAFRVEMKMNKEFAQKSTMLHSTHTGDIVNDFRLPGVFDTPDRTAHIRQFMNTTSYSTETIRYVTESWTDNAGMRAEGSAGSESSTAFTEQTANTKIISTYLTVSRESLADISFMYNHITNRGMRKIMLEEDNQILYGAGTGNNLSGIYINSSAYSDSLADTRVNRYDVLASAVTQATVNEYKPNIILLHPTDYDLLVRSKDANGMYVNPNAFFNNQAVYIHGARVVANTAVASDDFFVGDFTMGATLGIREDVTIRSTDSHASNFTAGMVTILIEERVALPIYRTNAFIYGDMSNALALGSA